MGNTEIILFICLMLFLICVIVLTGIGFDYLKFIKDYYNRPEDKTGLYDFIHINDNIISVDSIVNIKSVESIQEDTYKIIIELNDNKEPIIFNFENWRDCNDVFEQIQTALDVADIVTD